MSGYRLPHALIINGCSKGRREGGPQSEIPAIPGKIAIIPQMKRRYKE
jgi:hypothetical protein